MRHAHRIAITVAVASFALAWSATVVSPEARSLETESEFDQDPRIPLLALRLAGRPEVAVEFGEALKNRQPAVADELGIDLALAAAYEQQGRKHEAFLAWQRALNSATPVYSQFAAAQTARMHLELGRPDSAVQFARRALAVNPSWADSVVSTLMAAVEASGDCTALAASPQWNLHANARRRLRLAAARCRLEESPTEAVSDLVSLLRAETEDLVASEAAALLWPHRQQLDTSARAALANTLHHHRSFDRSTELLARLARDHETGDRRYKLARGHFLARGLRTRSR